MFAEQIHRQSGGAPRARRLHRAVALIFTLTVAANFIAMAFGPSPVWITYAPLPPLLALMATGVTMLAAPYLKSARGCHNSGEPQ